jgi:hypothetical protein
MGSWVQGFKGSRVRGFEGSRDPIPQQSQTRIMRLLASRDASADCGLAPGRAPAEQGVVTVCKITA